MIAPNPTSDLINVKFAGFEQKLKAEILSLDGQLILTKEFENLNGNVGFALNLGNITNGIYILQLRNDSIGIVKKIQIQH